VLTQTISLNVNDIYPEQLTEEKLSTKTALASKNKCVQNLEKGNLELKILAKSYIFEKLKWA
jgi:hypothetical protein